MDFGLKKDDSSNVRTRARRAQRRASKARRAGAQASTGGGSESPEPVGGPTHGPGEGDVNSISDPVGVTAFISTDPPVG
jgi:hypothetical protein